jgi:hypothetical protein
MFNAIIIVSASTGALGGIYSKWIAVAGATMAAIGTVVKELLPNIAQSEQELAELDRLIDFYSKYMNRLEILWYDFDNQIISEEKMIHSLFEMKDEECNKYSLMNKGIRSISKKEQNEIDNMSTEYINRVYNSKYD